MEKKTSYAIPIVVMILLFGMISFVTNLASPMGDILKNQFSIPNWQGTLGVFANFIAYAIMGVPAGNMLGRLGYKRTALIAVTVGFVGVGIQALAGVAASFGVYLAGAFIAGFSMCLLNTVVNPMLNRLGGGGNKGNQLIQFGGTFNSLCGTAVIVITGLLIPQGIKNATIGNAYPLMFAAMAIFALAFVVILFTRIPEPEQVAQKDAEPLPLKGLLQYRHFILGALAIFIYVGVEVGTPNILNKWLQNPDAGFFPEGVSAEAVAGSVTAFYWLLMLVGRLIGGIVGSKVSPRAMLAAVGMLAIVLVGVAIFTPASVMVSFPGFNGAQGFGMNLIPLSAALLVCVGLCTSVMWGGIFNLAVEGLGRYTEHASGLFMALVCGGGVLPLLQNGIVDIMGISGYQASYWVVVAGFAYILFYALWGSKPANK